MRGRPLLAFACLITAFLCPQDIGSGWAAAQTPAQYLSSGAAGWRSTASDVLDPSAKCRATPGTLQTMAAIVTAAGRNLIPEQKTCDVLCQV